MNVLGIETSCDETSAAIVTDGLHIRANIIASQADLHARYGGVVPEVASRKHVERMLPVVQEALDAAGMTYDDIHALAVTNRPGLLGALLVGVSFAKAFCYARHLPLVGVHHLEGHVYSAFLAAPDLLEQGTGNREQGTEDAGAASTPITSHKPRTTNHAPDEPRTTSHEPPFPLLILIVSGGHTQIIRMDGHGRYVLLGATRDDAAGEAFDKGARLLGLPYPGGPNISRLAETGDPRLAPFPRALMGEGLDFSFSGVKTSLRAFVTKENQMTEDRRQKADAESIGEAGSILEGIAASDVAAGYQAAIVDVLVEKMRRAAQMTGIRTLCVAGGVAANRSLQNEMRAMCERDGLRLVVPAPVLCTDNAAMIACAGYYKLRERGPDSLALDTYASEPLAGVDSRR